MNEIVNYECRAQYRTKSNKKIAIIRQHKNGVYTLQAGIENVFGQVKPVISLSSPDKIEMDDEKIIADCLKWLNDRKNK